MATGRSDATGDWVRPGDTQTGVACLSVVDCHPWVRLLRRLHRSAELESDRRISQPSVCAMSYPGRRFPGSQTWMRRVLVGPMLEKNLPRGDLAAGRDRKRKRSVTCLL